MSQVTIVQADDWSGLYVDGKLVLEGHEIEPYQLAIHCPIESIDVRYLESDGIALLYERRRFNGWADTLEVLSAAIADVRARRYA